MNKTKKIKRINRDFFKENRFWRSFYLVASGTSFVMMLVHHTTSVPGYFFVMGALCFILNFAPLQMEIKGI